MPLFCSIILMLLVVSELRVLICMVFLCLFYGINSWHCYFVSSFVFTCHLRSTLFGLTAAVSTLSPLKSNVNFHTYLPFNLCDDIHCPSNVSNANLSNCTTPPFGSVTVSNTLLLFIVVYLFVYNEINRLHIYYMYALYIKIYKNRLSFYS